MSGAARYEQGRLNRVTDHSPRNDIVDPAAFKGNAELNRDDAVVRKKILEGEIAVLKARIARAKAQVWEKNTFAPREAFHRWNVKLAEYISEVTKLDAFLREANAARPKAADWDSEARHDFAECFAQMAKEMLADVVYDRVRIAALHRMAERS